MILCFNCANTLPLIASPQSVVIGTLAASTEYQVYFGNVATERVTRITATTDLSGLLTVDLTEVPIMPDHEYTVWASIDEYKDRQAITIGGEAQECLSLRFDVVRDEAGDKISVETQTVELDD